MPPMTDREIAAFLDGLPARTGTLATVRADGRPHAAPVWFALDRAAAGPDAPLGELVFTTDASSVKGRNLARGGRAALCVDDDRPPFSFVTVEGPVTLDDDPGELLRWATVLGGRYMGAEQAEAYGRRNGVPGELVVRLRPHHVAAAARMAE